MVPEIINSEKWFYKIEKKKSKYMPGFGAKTKEIIESFLFCMYLGSFTLYFGLIDE